MKILEQNFRTSFGEIDIVARDGNEIVFVEVKTRASNRFGEPKEAVTLHKQHTIRQVATVYLKKHNLLDSASVRFDCISILQSDGHDFEVEHLKNAF